MSRWWSLSGVIVTRGSPVKNPHGWGSDRTELTVNGPYRPWSPANQTGHETNDEWQQDQRSAHGHHDQSTHSAAVATPLVDVVVQTPAIIFRHFVFLQRSMENALRPFQLRKAKTRATSINVNCTIIWRRVIQHVFGVLASEGWWEGWQPSPAAFLQMLGEFSVHCRKT